ncbi:hypothetical protein ACS0TY_008154 [Phlomoides rotata]
MPHMNVDPLVCTLTLEDRIPTQLPCKHPAYPRKHPADCCICVIGDFNSVRDVNERDGRSMLPNLRDIASFNGFVSGSGLIDLPLHGRKFSWYKPDGSCKSRIDRSLVNHEWISRWPNSSLIGLRRSISDHCPIVLGIKIMIGGLNLLGASMRRYHTRNLRLSSPANGRATRSMVGEALC